MPSGQSPFSSQPVIEAVLGEGVARELGLALADPAVALGWPKERVLVIDEDQWQSGKTADDRPGFQRLIAEVTMNPVGLILGLEVSRLARSNKDGHDLFELCAIFQTLLADQAAGRSFADGPARLRQLWRADARHVRGSRQTLL